MHRTLENKIHKKVSVNTNGEVLMIHYIYPVRYNRSQIFTSLTLGLYCHWMDSDRRSFLILDPEDCSSP